ncbi:hypothetical protein XELAEV_18041216mg [Xenopus laevis]|uniref:Uncharacterized protein n=1 Tax=Xenopus laevis TaxID=8355 RepID=A0A974C1R4_XENLA|nr:hypothetical protein XELAEV_18041216mg [Xenopus laevis]
MNNPTTSPIPAHNGLKTSVGYSVFGGIVRYGIVAQFFCYSLKLFLKGYCHENFFLYLILISWGKSRPTYHKAAAW